MNEKARLPAPPCVSPSRPAHRHDHAAGEFAFAAVAPRAAVLEASRDGFVPLRLDVTAASSAAPVNVVLPLSAVREAVTVSATATNAVALDAPAGTGSRLPIAIRDMPAAETVVGRALIDERGATDTQVRPASPSA